MTHFLKLTTASALALVLAACTTTGDMTETKMETKSQSETETQTESQTESKMDTQTSKAAQTNIVEAAYASYELSTLVSLLQQAELVETLSGDGPFTVFAPTNDAFALLPAETATMLMSPAGKDQLVKVLTGHVISGAVTSTDLMAQLANGGTYDATTVSGDTLTFYKMGEDIRVADENGMLARISAADMMQSNGVVHVVNSVLVPK